MMSVRVVGRGALSTAQRCLGVQAARMSSASGNLIVTTNEKTGVAVVQMNRKPVNSLNMEFLTEISITLEKLEKSAKGVILTSALPGIFSAGLDIMEMYQPKPERLPEFWRALQDMWIRLYGFQIPVISAINGHAPAGGCLMSISSDYRIMAEGKYTIGLNETLLGIVAPTWFMDTLVNTIGQRQSEKALQLGSLFTTEQALQVGLVDEVVPQDQVLARAEAEMSKWLKIPADARALTKMLMRQATIDRLLKNRQGDIDAFVKVVTKSSSQKMMGLYLQSLAKKAQK